MENSWRLKLLFVVLISTLLSACSTNEKSGQQFDFSAFEKNLEKSRQLLNIPAFSAVVVKNKEIIWAKGFGYADIKNNVKATRNTTYHLASLTKTFASTILMQLVEEGKVDLDDPVAKYGISFEQAREFNMGVTNEDETTVKHLLTHTAENGPGLYYRYNGYLFGLLDNIIEKSSGKTFGELVVEKILTPLQLSNTAPNFRDTVNFSLTGYNPDNFFQNMAKPYILDSLNNLQETELETYFGTAAGLMSSVVDMARYSMAIDKNKFLKKKTQNLVFCPTISTNGDTLPYGLGWFTQNYNNINYYWHYGLWNTNSSLIIKVPSKDLTFVILANSNNLSMPFSLGAGNLFTSVFALAFVNNFVLLDNATKINWELSSDLLKNDLLAIKSSSRQELLKQELLGRARLHSFAGNHDTSTKLFQLYSDIYSENLPEKYVGKTLLVKLDEAEDNNDLTVDFTIEVEQPVFVIAIGEGGNGEMWDYGWIENSRGKIVWKMNEPETVHAGGNLKNRLIDTDLVLMPGTYKLRFITDGSHSFNAWNSMPPKYAFYGIRIYSD